ncbi:MAG: metallophosphoesterase [Bacteroides sp.]|nr:metallophosphoesterase [Bacteroides sp.]MCM1389712.1 metallophosphoesterase [Bacteroides sp.]
MKCNFAKLVNGLLLMLLTAGCDAFESHPYSTKIEGKRNINTVNSERIEKMNLVPPFKFAFISDTQGMLDDTNDAMKAIKKMTGIQFMIHGGDQTDFGVIKEFVWSRNVMERSGLPFVSVIGNHDCLGNGDDVFAYIYGPENFSFNAGGTHFVCLNTVALEYDYSHPVPDFNFIEEDIRRVDSLNRIYPDSITHTVVAMHACPYDLQFNNNVAKPFNNYILMYPGMGEDDSTITAEGHPQAGSRSRAFCIYGHKHSYSIDDIYDNGVLYYRCPDIGKRSFLVFTITDEGYEFEKVDY